MQHREFVPSITFGTAPEVERRTCAFSELTSFFLLLLLAWSRHDLPRLVPQQPEQRSIEESGR